MRSRLDEGAPVVFGKRRASSAAAWPLGELAGRVVAELLVTDPSSGRNGSVITRTATQKATGAHGCRTIQRPRARNIRGPRPWGISSSECTVSPAPFSLHKPWGVFGEADGRAGGR